MNSGNPLSFPVCSSREIQPDFVGVFNKTIIPLALVGYEMIIANSALHASLAIYHLISKRPRGIIVNYSRCIVVYGVTGP